MAVSINAAAGPPAVKFTNATVVQMITASFSPPANSQLWIFAHWDNTAASSIDFSGSNGLTVTKHLDGNASGGRLAVGYANIPSGGWTGTITATTQTLPQWNGSMLYVMVVEGAEAVPGGATDFYQPAASWQRATGRSITTTQANSLIVAATTGWSGSAGFDWAPGAGHTELATDFSQANYQAEVWRKDGLAAIGTYTMNLPNGTNSEPGQMAIVEIREPGIAFPVLTAELYEGGVLKQTLGTASVDADGVASFTWDAATLTAISGANVELRLTSDLDIDVGAIEWNAQTQALTVTPVPVVDSPTVGITDTATVAAVLARTDAPTVGATDIASILVTLDRTDAPTVGITDTSTLLVTLARTDAPTVGITDAAAITAGLATTDTPTVGITDMAVVQGFDAAVESWNSILM